MKHFISTTIILSALAFILHPGFAAQNTHIDAEDLITLGTAPTASIVQIAPLYEETSTFLSEVYEADYSFQLLGVNWQQELPTSTAAQIQIHFREAGEWTSWQPIEVDQDGAYEDEGFWTYIITNESDAFQYRANLSTSDRSIAPKLSDISFDYVTGGRDSRVEKLGDSFSDKVTDLSRLIFKDDSDYIIDRDEWGANEDYRLAESHSWYDPDEEHATDVDDDVLADDPDMEIVETVTEDGGETLLWPLEYPKEVKKIIIHHTATTSNLDDPETAVRAIYYYHTMTRGWGDIGYNYIIDQEGNVYEGRYGGDGVVAGHTGGYNTGSVGVALLGNYEDEPVPGEMVQSLTDLIYEKAQTHDIEPNGNTKFRGEYMANILGHSDVGATACPGIYVYELLDGIADIVTASLDEAKHKNYEDDFAYETASDLELIVLEPVSESGVKIKIKNTGDETWDSSTYLKVNPNGDADDIVGFDEGSKGSIAKMNESSVKPGRTASFNFTVESGVLGGLAHFDLLPVFNGSESVKNYMDLGFYVEDPVVDFDLEDEDHEDILNPRESTTVKIVLENESNFTWGNSGDNKVVLKRSGSSSLTSSSTLATLKESSVKPGEEGTFEFTIKAPSGSGDYSLYYYPDLAEGDAHVKASGRLKITVTGSTDDALILGASSDLSFMPGETRYVWMIIENTSKEAWDTRDVDSFDMTFDLPSGMEVDEPRFILKTVNPGINLKVFLKVTAPSEDGEYTLEVRPRINGKNLTSNYFDLDITVNGEVKLTTDDYENPIRIKLTPDDEVAAPVMTSYSSFSLFDDDKLLKNFAANSRIRITPENGQYTVSSGYYKWYIDGPVRLTPQEEDGIVWVLTMNQKASWDETVNDNKFRGTIEVREVNGETVLINELPLESYVQGIAEETNTTPEEKLKTMSILARTYAYYYMTQAEKFPGMPYHLDDDPSTSQKYLGYGYEGRHPNVIEAAKETVGMIVTYDGEVVKTPYFSQSDGVATKSAQSVWGWTHAPYLQSVSDDFCEADAFWGHGVGLSGCGAKAMAEEGYSFDEIIEYYYTGVEIENL